VGRDQRNCACAVVAGALLGATRPSSWVI
jgi:hypothetical protein